MVAREKADKGQRLEELLRAYFLRAGFFVARGVPFLHAGEDLTDIDLWLYERPTGSSRRRQIVDAKSKTRPKAVERVLWTRGLAQLLDVDGAYVATTDARPMLRTISKKLGIAVLDGTDIRRINASAKVMYPDRVTEEEFVLRITKVDQSRRNKDFQQGYHDIKWSLIDNFGAGTINRSLESFAFFASAAVTTHPNTETVEAAIRLAYYAGAIVALSLDYISSTVSFRAAEERRIAFVNAIRYGNTDEATGLEQIRLALALVQKYAPAGDASAKAVESGVKRDLMGVPAEIVADYVTKNIKSEDLFLTARRFEHLAFSKTVSSFDVLSLDEKSFVGVLLDYCGVDRKGFASSWTLDSERDRVVGDVISEGADSGMLFPDAVDSSESKV